MLLIFIIDVFDDVCDNYSNIVMIIIFNNYFDDIFPIKKKE